MALQMKCLPTIHHIESEMTAEDFLYSGCSLAEMAILWCSHFCWDFQKSKNGRKLKVITLKNTRHHNKMSMCHGDMAPWICQTLLQVMYQVHSKKRN
jgi:hypothetical protein